VPAPLAVPEAQLDRRVGLDGTEALDLDPAPVQVGAQEPVGRAATSFSATRTTCSPRLSRKRSRAPETWRQSSIAHTRSPSRARAQTSDP
jgi:hypothetical protein